MPLMMDDDMEVDINDLFGDGADLPLPSRPPPKELFQRIDELRGSGCTQGIAWSKLGYIVSITQSGLGLEFRNLRCHPSNGSWDLTEPTTIPHITPNSDSVPLQHLCWSSNGLDLAVIDSAGRISILATPNFLNKPIPVRNAQMDPAEDLHAVVGALWYPVQQRPPVVHTFAIKQVKEYRYEMTQAASLGPSHPDPKKSVLICLTTNGVIRLLWQNDGKWREATKEIESIVSSNDLITHASICADKNSSLLVAYATATKQLYTIRVMVKWGDKTGDRNVNPTQATLVPKILVSHLAVTNWMEGNCTDGIESLNMQSSMVTLSHLQILPPFSDISGGPPRLPTVLTVRSCLPASPSQFNQDLHSIIDRWELRESHQTLHPAFEQLGSRKNSATQLNNHIFFRKIEGFAINKIVIFVQSIALDRIICFAYSDGSFEYRDRTSLAETFTEGNVDKFSHMPQIGFSYADEEPCLQVALSPTGCSFAQICCDKKVKWRALAHDIGHISDPANDVQYNAIIAGLTLSCSNAIFGSLAYDDILAIAHRYTSQPSFSHDWLTELARTLKPHLDYSEESHQESLIRNHLIQICLSIQNSLGYYGDVLPRSFGAKLAWIILQIRNCVILMTTAHMKIESAQRKMSCLEDAETVRMLSGSVRWCLDLMSWIIDSLLNPEDKSIFKYISTGQPLNLDELNNRLHTSNNVALHLLLSSVSRSFLTVLCRRLVQLNAISNAAQSQNGIPTHPNQPAISEALRKAYTNIATLTSNAIVPVRIFEPFLTSISASVKDAYSSAGLKSLTQQATQQQHIRPTESGRNLAEQNMVFGGSLPDELKPTITHVFTSLLPNFRPGIDLAKLYFHDFSLLALDPPPNTTNSNSPVLGTSASDASHRSSVNWRATRTVDIFQRVPVEFGVECGEIRGSTVTGVERGMLMPAKRWRRCARCAAVMEDVTSQRPATLFLIMNQRRCFCGGCWTILSGKQIVA